MLLRMEIFTRLDRQLALSKIDELISDSDGWIINHQLFSNVAASLIFEMPATSVQGFWLGLKEAGFNLKTQDSFAGQEKGDVRGTIAITFLHDEPDLKRDVPAFG